MSSTYKHTLCCLFFLLATTGFMTRAATADNLFLAGATVSEEDSAYAYIGTILPILGSTLGSDGWRIKLWGSYNSFEYDGKLAGGATGVATRFDGDGPGAEASIGYRGSFLESGVSTFYLGVAYRDIDIDPDDPSAEADEENLGLKIQEELSYDFTDHFTASALGSYTFGFNSAYYARVRPGYKMDNGWKIGPEAVFLGGEFHDKQKYGAYISGIKLGNIGLGFSVGHEDKSSSDDDGIYGSVSFSLVY